MWCHRLQSSINMCSEGLPSGDLLPSAVPAPPWSPTALTIAPWPATRFPPAKRSIRAEEIYIMEVLLAGNSLNEGKIEFKNSLKE